MDAGQKHLGQILRLGFGLILVLNLMLGIVGLSQLHRVRAGMAEVVEVNNAKMEYAYAMRDAIRLRALSTTKILATEDYFERDEELIKFYGYAAQYRDARDKLVMLGLNPEEAELHQQLTERTRKAQPLNRAAAEMLQQDVSEAEYRDTLKAARVEQDKVLALLERAIALEKRFTEEALRTARHQSNLTIGILLLAGLFIILLEAYVAKVVIRFVSQKNRDLAMKNEELAYASIRADEATRAKTEFLANMSHEIRTPLTTIIGFSDTLANLQLSRDEQQIAVDSIHQSSLHLFDIINDILDISKIEIGSIDYEILDVSPVKVVDDVLGIIGEKARSEGLALTTRFEFPLPRFIKTDPTRLKQILLNLCSNALKFTHRGGITITVVYLSEPHKIQFKVADTGIGMSAEQMGGIFKVFQQADSSTTRRYGGTGLGLAISRQIARDLGGDISCQSEIHRGSVFEVTIDTGLEHAELIYEDEDRSGILGPTRVSRSFNAKVLLAEDSSDIQALIRMYLKRMGITPTIVGDGAQACDAALRRDFDLILMDMHMPQVDGLQAIRQLRAKGYKKPIIVLSANALKQNRSDCLQAGAQEYLTKPVDLEQLQQALSEFLPHTVPNVIAVENERDDEFEALVQEFLGNLTTAIEELQHCARDQDFATLRAKAHKLKGAGGSFGFPQLSHFAKDLMQAVDNHQVDHIAQLLQQLQQYGSNLVRQAG
ncbi:MAG: ATP-binding protein [Gammaproteobacteria bacterium]|nr:ATP-binding protein [Gammaproteobacteria bacterium]MDH5799652.1 ATP-binding protein [Gammaproteobacteria bacterium]